MQAAYHTAAVVSPYLHAVLPHVSVLIRSGALLQYRNLGEVYGLPKMHYKGKQGDFYIMVCCLWPTLLTLVTSAITSCANTAPILVLLT